MHRLLLGFEHLPLVLRLDRPEAARTLKGLSRSLPMAVDPHGAEIAGRHLFRHAPVVEPVEVGAEVGALPPGTFPFGPARQVLGLLRGPLKAERASVTLLGPFEGPNEPVGARGDRLRRVQRARPLRDRLERLDGAPPPPAEPPRPPVPNAIAVARRTLRAAPPAQIDAALGRRGFLPAEPLPLAEAEARELRDGLRARLPEAEADPASAARAGGLLAAGRRALGELPGANGATCEEVEPIAGRLVGWLDERFPRGGDRRRRGRGGRGVARRRHVPVLNRPGLSELRKMYRRAILVWRLEEELGRLHEEGRTRGPIHRCDGQEAVGIDAIAALEPEDLVTSTHRGHAQPVGKGVPLGPLVTEILGRVSGSRGGRAGHMLVADPEAGLLGGCGIVGGMLPVAVGQALALQVRGEPKVVCAFLDDGAARIGAAHEAVNLAGLWCLPVVFLAEADGFGRTVPSAARSAVAELATRAAGSGMPGRTIRGNDGRAVFAATAEAAAHARRGEGPSPIEARTRRLEGFSTSDPGGRRDPAEVTAWRARDPIARLRRELLPELGGSALLALEGEAERELGIAIEAALAAPPPPADTLAAPEYASEATARGETVGA